MKLRLQHAARWVGNRAWSRAGAVADVLASAGPRRALVLTTRLVLMVAGSTLIGTAVALMLWNDFGPGPLDVFIAGLSHRTGLPLALSVWAVAGAMAALAWSMGRRPGVGTVVAPLLIGPVLQASLEWLGDAATPNTTIAQVCVHIVAIGFIGVGAGALIVSGLGAGTGELLASATSDRFGKPEPLIRLVIEVAWITVGVLLGGPVGVGTVLVAALIGPAVVNGHRWVDALVSGSRRGVIVTGEVVARQAARAGSDLASD